LESSTLSALTERSYLRVFSVQNTTIVYRQP